MIRVVLADDHPLVRSGIRAALSAQGDIEVVGEAADADTVRELCLALRPDVVLLDLRMSGAPPLATVAALRKQCATTRVVVLTAYDDDAYVQGMVLAGVAGYVLKDERPEVIVHALHDVMQGRPFFSRAVVDKLAQVQAARAPQPAGPTLSEHEQSVLRLLILGRSDSEIGEQCGIAERTVRYHLRSIFDKLGVNSRIEAAVKATRLKLVSLDPPPDGD